MKPRSQSHLVLQKRVGLRLFLGQGLLAERHHPHPRLCNALAICCAILSLFLSSSSGWTADSSFGQQFRTVFSCDFQSMHDQNADRQPDGWRRRRDRNHPAYIAAEIVSRDAEMAARARQLQILTTRAYQAWKTGKWDREYVPESIPPFLTRLMDGVTIRNCYEVRIDGGAFELVSPRFPMDPRLSYQFSLDATCQELTSHLASVELHVMNDRNERVELISSQLITGSRPWHLLESQIIALNSNADMLYGELHLIVKPESSGHGKGSVRFDNIVVYELPRISLESNLPYCVAEASQPFELSFQAIGISPKMDSAVLELIDIENQVVSRQLVPIERTELTRRHLQKPVSAGKASMPQVAGLESESSQSSHSWTNTRATYQFTIDNPGYYRLRMSLSDHVQSELPISVLSQEPLNRGAFGWTLSDVEVTLPDDALQSLIHRLGVGLVKLPIWIDYQDSAKMELLGKWMSRVSSDQITCIGILDRPLNSTPKFSHDFEKFHPAATLSDSKVWFETVEPILSSLGMTLDWLQIGLDDDRSSLQNSQLSAQLAIIRNQIHAIGQDHLIAIGWDWRNGAVSEDAAGSEPEPVVAQSTGWNALHLTSQPQITLDEMLAQAKQHQVANRQTWTSLVPLPASGHPAAQRVLDLVQQMIAVRRANLDAVFLGHVVDSEFGLFHQNQRSSHLLLPWVQMASVLSGKKYMGSITLPQGSINHIFSNDQETVAILWSQRPANEQIFLGDEIQLQDIWGRSIPIEKIQYPSGSIAHEIPLGTWPLIVRNVDLHVVRWQQEFELKTEQLPSQIADKGSFPVKVQNTLGQNAKGNLHLYANSLFQSGTVSQPLDIEPEAIQEWDIPFQFLPDASAGDHQVEFAFQLQGKKEYRFSIHREIKLGHRDLELNWKVVRLNDAIVELQVEVLNSTPGPVSFDCKLFPRGAAYQRIQIIGAEPGSTVHSRRIQIPREKDREAAPIWARCEQIGSSLVLNYRLSESE
jgi:hypothetical protein